MDPGLSELSEGLLPGEEVQTEPSVGLSVLVKEEGRVDILLPNSSCRVRSSLVTVGLAVVVQTVNVLTSAHGVINLPGDPEIQQCEVPESLHHLVLTQCLAAPQTSQSWLSPPV